MKILITTPIDKSIEANPFVKVISEGLESYGNAVTCSRDLFWETPTAFDLILFQWPQDILTIEERVQQDPTTISFHLQRIEKQLQFIKSAHIPMFITVHNLQPHNKIGFLNSIYELVYKYVDAFHHMGNYSFKLMKEQYPNAYHFVVPHPSYYDFHDVSMNQSDCKKKFGLPSNKPVVLAFGAFRNDDERGLFLDLCCSLKSRCCFWAPKFNRYLGVKRGKMSKLCTYARYRMKGIKMYRGAISDHDVKEMVNAADIVFIQRKKILNSGNLPLGFSFGKIVVGPDVGNVGCILRETGNPVFDPNDSNSVISAMELAYNMYNNDSHQGKKNYEYAKAHWHIGIVTKMIDREIRMVIKNRTV